MAEQQSWSSDFLVFVEVVFKRIQSIVVINRFDREVGYVGSKTSFFVLLFVASFYRIIRIFFTADLCYSSYFA